MMKAPTWLKIGWLLAAFALALGGVWAVRVRPEKPASSAALEQSPLLSELSSYSASNPDDSGTQLSFLRFALPIKDPYSLEHIRDCYVNAGYRGIALIEQELGRERVSSALRLEGLLAIARLYLYEGDFTKASATLEKARDLAEQGSVRHWQQLPGVIFMQGIAALRRGETENCVQCRCVSSCIFPIRPEAVHQKPAGSRQAVKHFTEFLQLEPENLGARWLLNVAYMTLGEYPSRVPPQYLIPGSAFPSAADIGRFIDVAPLVGVDRLNMSGGAIMDDFDNDGLLDIVQTTSDWAESMRLYRNRGDGTFEDRTKAAGLENQLGGLYCVQTDYNNDGWLDIYVARGAWTRAPQRHSLLRNNGDGTFTDVTKEAGLDYPVDGQVAAWADYDNDGYLDLFVGGESVRSRLYHNRGDGTFEEVAQKAGVANEGFMCKGANWGDFDGDGLPDLFVNNHNGRPRLFHNNGDGTFTDVAGKLGIRQPTQGFSCWFFDYDNDGWPDIFATSFELSLDAVIRSQLGLPANAQTGRLYRNLAGRGFQDVTKEMGLELALCPMGSNFADLDNDGFLDIYLATGTPSFAMLVPNRLFKNEQGKRFVDATVSSGTGHLQKGHAVAAGDWDRDGNVDMLVMLGGAAPGDRFRNVLFQNPGHKNHWITIKLVGKKTNRPAIGARIKVTVPGTAPNTFYRHVTTGSSFGANALQQTIGLGKAEWIERLEVSWPTSKTTQVFQDLAVDQAIEITEFGQEYRRLNWSRVPVPKGPSPQLVR
jgi:hypothetical protein